MPGRTTSSAPTMPRSPTAARRAALNAIPNIIPLVVLISHIFLSPYTKVEESFTLHAVHDVLAYGPSRKLLEHWDHITFPGAVPRSFFPPIVLGLLTYPFAVIGVALGMIKTKLGIQILVRIILSIIHCTTFNHLSKTLRRKYGPLQRTWFLLLSLTQFHIPYYSSRTLPNFMIFPIVLLSYSYLLRSTLRSGPTKVVERQKKWAVRLMVFGAANCRLELAALIGPIALGLVGSGRMGLEDVLKEGGIGGFGSLLLAGPIDYCLWSKALPNPSLPTFTSPWQFTWPELASFKYNLLEGQSANWGIMSKHYYFTNSLPKLLMASTPLLAFGIVWTVLDWVGIFGVGTNGSKMKSGNGIGNGNGSGSRDSMKGLGNAVREILGLFGLGVVGLIGVMSMVGHKEWRFIVYVVPIFNIIAALTAASLWSIPSKLQPLLRLGLIGLVALNILGTAGFTFISLQNYPGGKIHSALERLQAGSSQNVTIHYQDYPLQTGSSLFTFLHEPLHSSAWPYHIIPNPLTPHWIYSKTEDPGVNTPEGAYLAGYDFLITDSWKPFLEYQNGRKWKIAEEIVGYDGISRGGKYGIGVKWGTKAVILRKRADI